MTGVGSIRLDTRRLDEIAARLGTNSDNALGRIAGQVSGIAKILAPYDTGALMNSIDFERIREGLWEVHDGVEYGIYQELGTHKMAAHPFMVPACEQVANQVGAEFTKELFK